jgi:xanthine dehydrogenase iron-sulfur cluster and FAD-binding subunit A
MLFFIGLFAVIVGSITLLFHKVIKQFLFPEGRPTFFSDENEPFLGLQLTQSKGLRMSDIKWSNMLTVFVNGNSIQLTNPDPSELLVNFIRDKVGLKGTKLGCEEGGCGACTVVLTKPEGIVSVNSCLRPLCANDGMAITTVEGIGSVKDDLSPEQARLVAHNGTQCGYCTPGWITNMHALNQSNEVTGQASTKREIDAYLDGNICRCTGYRPIMQAFQSFADESAAAKVHPCVQHNCSAERMQQCSSSGHDIASCSGPHSGSSGCGDLEDHGCGGGGTSGNRGGCSGNKPTVGSLSRPLGSRRTERDLALVRNYTPQPLMFFNPVTGQRWIRPVTMEQLCAVLREVAATPEQAQTAQLVGGNTSIGVTKYLNGTAPYNASDKYATFIDVNLVKEMVAQDFNAATTELIVGAASPISSLISLLNTYAVPLTSVAPTTAAAAVTVPAGADGLCASESATGHLVNHHSVFSVTANHLSKIANTQVRNAGSWAGNLMVFLKYPTFPSDAVLALTTANARLRLSNSAGQITEITMDTFLTYTLEQFQSEGLMIVALVIVDSPTVNSTSASNTNTGSVFSTVTRKPSSGPCADFVTETFKVAQRARNAHAHVNAGFQFMVQPTRLTYVNPSTGQQSSSGPPTILSARIVYGGVSNKIFIAQRCQAVLANALATTDTLSRALVALQADLLAAGTSTEVLGDQRFRESVMQSCLYRALLRCYPVFALPSTLISAVQPWVMPISRGVELFVPPHGSSPPGTATLSSSSSSSSSTNPIGQPVRKLEAKIQSTGEAVYPSDETMPPQGLFGAIVFSTACAKVLQALDASPALALPGVVRSLCPLTFAI